MKRSKPAASFGSAAFWRFLKPQLRPHSKPLAVALALNCLHGAAISFQTLTPKYLIDDVLLKAVDEATSALDTVSNQLIQEALDRNLRGRTAIFIAHRLATIEACDRIIVLHEGQTAQDGSFATLREQPGLFREMIEADVFRSNRDIPNNERRVFRQDERMDVTPTNSDLS